MVSAPDSILASRAPSSVKVRCVSTARLRSSAKGTVVVAPSGNGSTIPCPKNAPSSKMAMGPRSRSPPLLLVKRATRNGCACESGTPPSGAKRKIDSPGTRLERSMTIVALLSGTVIGVGRS